MNYQSETLILIRDSKFCHNGIVMLVPFSFVYSIFSLCQCIQTYNYVGL